ncbi:ATP-dependent DNA ligase, partial [Streptomyces lasiicapitis]
MLFVRVAEVSSGVAATSARSRKIELMAELFRAAEPEDVPLVIPYLAGRLPQGRIGVGWNALKDPVPPADAPTLTVGDVGAARTPRAGGGGAGAPGVRRRVGPVGGGGGAGVGHR